MTQATDFKIAFLERIATPLLSSIVSAQNNTGSDDEGDAQDQPAPKSEAQNMALLLGKSVELSAKLSDLLDIKQAGDKAESIRISLAAVSANFMAQYQAQAGNIPDEATLKRLLSAMETALMFADHFEPSAEHISRLGNIEIDGAHAIDVHHIRAQYMNIMVPVVLAVSDYTFGRDEKKLVLEIAEKLSQTVTAAVKGSAADHEDELVLKYRELSLLKAAVAIYADCHRSDTARIMNMSDEGRAKLSEESGNLLSMETVWANFANRFAMLELLSGMPESKGAPLAAAPTSAPMHAQTPTAAAPQQASPVSALSEPSPIREEPAPQQEAAPVEPPAEEVVADGGGGSDDSGASPMSFFAKKRESGNTANNTDGETSGGTMV